MKVGADLAQEVANDLLAVLGPVTHRLEVAGSLRRRKALVSDVEILFIPAVLRSGSADLFGAEPLTVNLAERSLDALLSIGLLKKRPKSDGTFTWGYKNKLAVHAPSGIAVDLFTASESNWFNYLVCRTGGERNNIAIASAAIARGWKWNPYGEGFTCLSGIAHKRVESEREVFEFVGLPYLEPWLRQ